MRDIFNLNNARNILNGRISRQLIIQYTDYCNGTCPQCGMRKTETFKRTKLPKEEIKKLIDAAADKKVQSLSFTGGEPFIFTSELIEMIKYATKKGIPLIRTGTNGFMFTHWQHPNYKDKIHKLAEELSQTNLRNFWISIDSSDPNTHEEMRGLKGVIKGIEIALPIFHEHGIYPAANLGINRNILGFGKIPSRCKDKGEFYEEFKTGFTSFYEFIIDLGFTMTNVCYPMSVDESKNPEMGVVYGASSANQVISFTNEEKVLIFKALMDTIPSYRSKIRIFTPRSSLYSLIEQYEKNDYKPLPCKGGIDFFFVDSTTGDTFPCGFRGNDNLGKFYDMDIDHIKNEPFCTSCDWECFRDPSELIGFAIELIHKPIKTLKSSDPAYKEIWKEDVKYYNACDYFDGRIASKL